MKLGTSGSLLALAASTALASTVTAAMAGGFAIREQSAEYQGASFAGNATGGQGLSSIFFNPATVTQHDGLVSEDNLALILPYSRAKDAGPAPGVISAFPNSGNVGEWAFVPASYYSYQVNDRVYFGLSINSPFGLATKADHYWGSPHGRLSDIFNANATPMVGIKMDNISFAFGVQVDYIEGRLTSAFYQGINAPVTIASRVKGDDWGVGFVAGVLVDITDRTQLGLGFRSGISHTLDGSLKTDAPPLLGRQASAKVPVDLPATATLSLRHQLTDEFTLLGSVEWADWSALQSLDIQALGTTVSSQPFNWNDSWFFSVGGEWQATDALTLRTGFAYEDSPVPDSTRGPRLPDNNRYWVSVGASYKWNDWLTLHGAYSHVFMDNGDVAQPATAQMPSPLYATFKQHIDIVSLSGTVNW